MKKFTLLFLLLLVNFASAQNPSQGDTNRGTYSISGRIGLYTNGATVGQVMTYNGPNMITWGAGGGDGGTNAVTDARYVWKSGNSSGAQTVDGAFNVTLNSGVNTNTWGGALGTNTWVFQSAVGGGSIAGNIIMKEGANIRGSICAYSADLGGLLLSGGGDPAVSTLASFQLGSNQMKYQTPAAGNGFSQAQGGPFTLLNGTPIIGTGGGSISGSFTNQTIVVSNLVMGGTTMPSTVGTSNQVLTMVGGNAATWAAVPSSGASLTANNLYTDGVTNQFPLGLIVVGTNALNMAGTVFNPVLPKRLWIHGPNSTDGNPMVLISSPTEGGARLQFQNDGGRYTQYTSSSIAINSSAQNFQIGNGDLPLGVANVGFIMPNNFAASSAQVTLGSINWATLVRAATGQVIEMASNVVIDTAMAISTNSNLGKLFIPISAVATNKFGTISIGGGPWVTGATAFTGSANGTHLAMNTTASSTANMVDFQQAGTNRFLIDGVGHVYIGTNASSLSSAIQITDSGATPITLERYTSNGNCNIRAMNNTTTIYFGLDKNLSFGVGSLQDIASSPWFTASTTGVTIGSGTIIKGSFATNYSITFPSILVNVPFVTNVVMTGVTAGAPVNIGTTIFTAGIITRACSTNNNQATIEFANVTAAPITPSTQTINLRCWNP